MSQIIKNTLPAQTALGSDSTTMLGQVSNVQGTDNYLKAWKITPPTGYTTVTHSATDYCTFTLKKRSGTAAAVTVGTIDTSATDLVADTVLTGSITESAANQSSLTEDDILEVVMHQTGSTGIAIGANLQVEVEVA